MTKLQKNSTCVSVATSLFRTKAQNTTEVFIFTFALPFPPNQINTEVLPLFFDENLATLATLPFQTFTLPESLAWFPH
jgi:hypothetical protein